MLAGSVCYTVVVAQTTTYLRLEYMQARGSRGTLGVHGRGRRGLDRQGEGSYASWRGRRGFTQTGWEH